jgi:hypothetical protein
MSGYGNKKPAKSGYGSVKAAPMMSPTKTAKTPNKKMGKDC